MLKLENVSVKRGNRIVIDGINLEVESGEIVQLNGACGVGKSTLLMAASGMLRYSGQITIDGADLKSRAARLATAHVGDPFAENGLCKRMTVKEHFRMRRIACGADESMVENARKILTGLQKNDIFDRLICELSTMEQRKVEIASAVAEPAKLYLLDRPMLGLTHEESEELASCMLAMKAKGCAILATTSDVSELPDGIASRIITLENGRLAEKTVDCYTNEIARSETEDSANRNIIESTNDEITEPMVDENSSEFNTEMENNSKESDI